MILHRVAHALELRDFLRRQGVHVVQVLVDFFEQPQKAMRFLLIQYDIPPAGDHANTAALIDSKPLK